MRKIKKMKIKRSKWGTVITVLLGLWLAAFAIAYLISGNSLEVKGDNKIVFIPINGMITTGTSSGSLFGSDTAISSQIADYLKQAEEDESIKGVILEINSPGGTVVATKEIADAVKKTKNVKPVIAWIREVGASGAYWVASASNGIVADPMSITGSIGVTSSYLEFTGLMEEHGIGYEELKAGKYKEVGSPFRELKEEERRILNTKLSIIQAHFVNAISENRDMPKKEVMELATGMFYLGQEAHENGLVDHLGSKDLAINITEELAGIENAKLVKYEQKKSVFDLLSKISHKAFYSIGRGIGAEFNYQSKVSNNLEVLV